ncbi:DUF2066 domain-containing protein, partial [Xanthomonas oryzae pv. oryzae]
MGKGLEGVGLVTGGEGSAVKAAILAATLALASHSGNNSPGYA